MLKVKEGSHLVNSIYCSGIRKDKILINLVDRWTYKGFKQKKNRFIIDTTEGEIAFVFRGETRRLEFQYQEKDQLVFKVLQIDI